VTQTVRTAYWLAQNEGCESNCDCGCGCGCHDCGFCWDFDCANGFDDIGALWKASGCDFADERDYENAESGQVWMPHRRRREKL
jgi:hypothetical protein